MRGQVPFARSEEAKSSNPEKRIELSDVKVSVSTVPLDKIGKGSREPLNSAISCIVSPAPSWTVRTSYSSVKNDRKTSRMGAAACSTHTQAVRRG
jgi:hypothetical protein